MAHQLTEQQRQVKNADEFRNAFMNLHMSAVPIIMVRTREPFRVNDTLKEFAFGEDGLAYKCWSVIHGWSEFDKANPDRPPQPDGTCDPLQALKNINGVGASGRNNTGWPDGVYAMMYPHMVNLSKNPGLIHLIKEYAKLFAENRKRLVLIVPPTYELPAELEDDVTIMDFEVPSYAELYASFDKVLRNLPSEKMPNTTKPNKPHYVNKNNLLSIGAGMTQAEFENALARAIVEHRDKLPDVEHEDLADILSQCKTEVVKKTDVLEIVEAEDMDNIGGLDNLKAWLTLRVASFTEEAMEFGIRPPRGITLVGPPGTGKSLVAKATAHMLGLPLIRFDVSRIFQSLVGQSESRVRSTLKLVDAMAPCVLFMDELDKIFGGTVAGLQGDSGVGQRVLGSILTWLQEGTSPVFVVATANRVEYLPPEMMRRGRMDEVFSVQMPDETERMEILRIHLRKRGHDPDAIEGLEIAVAASAEYVGAELEAAVKDAMIEAWAAEDHTITGQMIAEQLGHLKPLSQAFPEQFQAMATWAHNNARPANRGEPPAPPRTRSRAIAVDGGRAMDIGGEGQVPSGGGSNLDG